MTTRDWAVDAAEDAMLFCDNPVIDENDTLITDPTRQMYMLADRIRGFAHLARGERDGEVVAWMRRHITYRGVDGRREGERVVSEAKVYPDDVPLYVHPRPVVPEEPQGCDPRAKTSYRYGYSHGWKAARGAMLAAAPESGGV